MRIRPAFSGIWALAPEALASLREAYARAMERGWDDDDASQSRPAAPYVVEGRTAVVHVRGILHSDAATWLDLLFGGGSRYGEIVAAAQAAARDFRIDDIRLAFDSPGGAAVGLVEASHALREVAAIKPLVSYARGYCTSAAYWLACCADRIVASPDAILGSIGTVVEILDDTRALERAGFDRFQIVGTRSPRKRLAPSDPEGLVDRQQVVDDLTDNFIDWVAARRGVTPDHVVTQMGGGSAVVARRGLASRLCDELVSLVPGTSSAPAAPPPAPSAPPPPAPTERAAQRRTNTRPERAAVTPGEPMNTCELQCRAAIAALAACLSVLSETDEAHAEARTACDAATQAANACLDAGAEPGSEAAMACADACDAAVAALDGLDDMPECKAAAASCEACAVACRNTDSGEAPPAGDQPEARAQESEMKELEKLRQENARLQAELRAEKAASKGQADKASALESRLQKLEAKDTASEIQRMLDRHIVTRGAVPPVQREEWAKEAETHGVEAVDRMLSRIPDGAARPTKLRGSDEIPRQVSETQRQRDEIKAIQDERKCSRAEAHRIWGQRQAQAVKENA